MFSGGTVHEFHEDLLRLPPVLRTRDMDEAASCLAVSAVPYRSELIGSSSIFSTQIFGARSPRIRLSRVRTNGSLRVQAGLGEDSYAVVLAVAGELEHRIEHKVVCVRLGCGLVQSPWQIVDARTPEQFELLFLKIERAFLVQELESRLGDSIKRPLVFSTEFNVGTQAGQRFRQLILMLCPNLTLPGEDDLQRNDPRWSAAMSIENELAGLLLEGQRHNYSRMVARQLDAGPWQLRAAEEYIRANAHLTLSLGDICAAAGVNSRTLQHSFQRKRGCSPMQFLRRLRLERVHAELSQPGGGSTVTKSASRWGFLHFGRFAAEYQAHFGERPSQTLQKARAQGLNQDAPC